MGLEFRKTDNDQVCFHPLTRLEQALLLTSRHYRYAVSNIRDLLGHKVDLNFIESNAAVRLDKD